MILHLIKPQLIYFVASILTIEIFNLLQILVDSEKVSTEANFNPSLQKIHYVVDTKINCGIKQTCPSNSFSLFLSTGVSPNILPRLCVSGKDVISPRINEERRGLNGAIIEPNYFEAISVRNFDTHQFNKSAEILKWLQEAYNNSIIVLFTFDEASKNLDELTKAVLISFGSGKIQNLFYRSQWFMITQKGTPGFTIYEKLSHAKKKKWGAKIEFQGCIPKIIPKKNITVDKPLRENRQKAQFCRGKKDDKYKGFCSEPRFEIIMPTLLTNRSLIGNTVYFLPIFLFASSNLEIFIASVESLIHQPGITLPLVTVLYEDNASLSSHDDITSLCKIYGINSNSIKSMASFETKIEQIQRILNKVAPHKQYALVIDSEVILSPDFLFFMAQTLPVMQKDTEISVISAWSSNCYVHEGNIHEVYRIRGVPKYAALISITKKINNFINMFAPDVARLQGPEACHIPSLESNNWIERPQDLLKYRYFHKMVMLQQLSQIIEVDEILNSCSSSSIKNETNVIYIEKSQLLGKLLHCLGVLKNQYGLYEGIVRLFVNGKNVLVITNESSFYKSRPVASVSNRSFSTL